MFLRGLEAALHDLKNNFVLQINHIETVTLDAISFTSDILKSIPEPVATHICWLLDRLPGNISLAASNYLGWQGIQDALTETAEHGEEQPLEELPEGLTRIRIEPKDAPSVSAERRELEGKLAGLIKSHFRENRNGTLSICLEGPPGTGKTTLALAAARMAGFETYRMAGFQSKYVSESATRLKLIFKFLRSRQAVVIYDEIDTLVGRRVNHSRS